MITGLSAHYQNIKKKKIQEVILPNRHIQIYEALKHLSFVDHPLYHKEEASKLLTYDLASDENAFVSKRKGTYESDELSCFLPHLSNFHVLRQPAEQKLFLKLNYAKHRAKLILNELETESDFDKAAGLLDVIHETRNILVNHNLRLMVSTVKMFKINNRMRFEDHISDGNLSVIKAVEKFDVSRGYKFSTYLVYALKMNYWKSTKVRKKDIPFAISISDEFHDQHMPSKDEQLQTFYANDDIRAVFDVIETDLSEKEKKILFQRFGVKGYKRKTLRELGEDLNCTKEWVRLLQKQTLEKLKQIFGPNGKN